MQKKHKAVILSLQMFVTYHLVKTMSTSLDMCLTCS